MDMRIRSETLLLAALWTATIGIAFALGIYSDQRHLRKIITASATTSLNADQPSDHWMLARHDSSLSLLPLYPETATAFGIDEQAEPENAPDAQGHADRYSSRFDDIRLHLIMPDGGRTPPSDPWEQEALEKIAQGADEVFVQTPSSVRLMRPVFADKACLHCHSEYDSALPIGGASITAPLAAYRSHLDEALLYDGLPLGGLWIIGLGGILYRGRCIRRKQMERQLFLSHLEQSRRRLAEAQRIARIGNWEWHIRDKRWWWSDEACRIFGAEAQQLQGTCRTVLQYIHPDDRRRIRMAACEALEQGSHATDHRIMLSNGETRFVHTQGKVERDAQGNPVRVLGTVHDITTRKQQERCLQQAATVFEESLEGIMITDTQGCIATVNRAFTEITGYCRSEISGQPPHLLRAHAHDGSAMDDMLRQTDNNGRWQGEIWLRCKNGEEVLTWLSASLIGGDTETGAHHVIIFSDISTLKQDEAHLHRLTHHDPLTGLPNILLIQTRLNRLIEHAQQYNHYIGALIVDVDDFKIINDSLGHPCGDQLLQQIAQRFKKTIRGKDTLARWSGDAFIVLIDALQAPEDARLTAERLLAGLESPFHLEGHEIHIRASIGISIYPSDGDNADTMINHADAAMHAAKAEQAESYRFYESDLTALALKRMTLETELRQALKNDEFRLCYQPQVELATGRITGCEALIRWHHPDRGIVMPVDFIEFAEACGLIVPIGEWVLHEACARMRQWIAQGLRLETMAINVSGRQLAHETFAATVADALRTHALSPGLLEIELTESLVMEGSRRHSELLAQLHALGVTIAIDDFGTGYSSLNRLKHLPIDTLKIDKSFIDGLPEQPTDAAIINTILSLAENLGIQAIAEGVENSVQEACLCARGCGRAQGYLYSHPLPPDDFVQLCQQQGFVQPCG